MANLPSFVSRGISNILKLIGCFVVFLFVLGYIINYAENFIPYTIIPRDRLNNPNKFNTDYVYDEMNNFSDWRGTLKSKTMESMRRLVFRCIIYTSRYLKRLQPRLKL